MKKIITIAAMFTSFAVINKTEAQVGFSAGVSVGGPGAMVDANYNNYNENPGYYNNTNNYSTDDYYYLPDIDAYYNIPLQQYVYFDGGRWITNPYLPAMYRGFDLYAANKYRIHEARPYLRADFYRNRYAPYRREFRPAPVVVNRGGYAYNNGYGRDYGHNVYRDDRHIEYGRGGYGHEEHGYGHDDHGFRGRH